MLPTHNQIELAAYHRWLRRHQAHGYDRDDWVGSEKELTYSLNYQPIVRYPLDSTCQTILGDVGPCRFCERTTPRATFSRPRPVVQGLSGISLVSSQICDECQEDCRASLAGHCQSFWKAMRGTADAHQVVVGADVDLLAVFKSLVVTALLIMPEDELGFFPDTLEWANNPDHEFDRGHFDDGYFRIYHAPFLENESWTSLARRIDDEAVFPYMLLSVASNGIILELSVPMSVRDEDLEGRVAMMPERSLISGEGSRFREARTTVLRLSTGRRQRVHGGSFKHAFALAHG